MNETISRVCCTLHMQHPRRRRWYVQYLAADYAYNNTRSKVCERHRVRRKQKKKTNITVYNKIIITVQY